MDDVTHRLKKARTGIEGLDQMTGGGLPRGRTTLIVGAPGAGKTVFSLQTLVNGARQCNEPGIFVAFEEQADHIRANAAAFGWDLPALEEEKLFFLDARIPIDTVHSGEFDIGGILAGVEARAQKMGARRVVFDAVDVLLAMLDDARTERREIYRLHEWLQSHDLTGIITAKRSEQGHLLPERYDFLQFMADCVISLEHTRHELVSQRYLNVAKYRGSAFVEKQSPMLIGPGGIHVARPDPMRMDHRIFDERISSGVARLDEMLDGGYYRGSNVLLTGAPGTAKSTLAGAFAAAACRRGERVLYVSFDEAAPEIVRNLASVNVLLQPHLDAGLLRMHSAFAGFQSTEGHMMELERLIDEHQPRCMVIDPFSALLKAGQQYNASEMGQRLLHRGKAQGITTLSTSLLEDDPRQTPSTEMQVSTVADTWIHLSYEAQGGEQNRALQVIKSRGTAHSNQIRELVLSDTGVTLRDVYTVGGEVLMGTLRWQKEEEERREAQRAERELQRRRRELELAEAEVEARMRMLQRQLQAQRAELEQLAAEEEMRQEQRQTHSDKVRELRQGATPTSDGEPN